MGRTAHGGCLALLADSRHLKRPDSSKGAGPERGGRVSAGGTVATKPEERLDVLDTDEAKLLLDAGREAGSLTTVEIALALEELDLDAAHVEEIYHALEDAQIEILAPGEPEEIEQVDEAREVSTDALQHFLKDIGKVELL